LDQDFLTIIRYPNLRDHGITMSRGQISTMVRDGRFPAPVELSSMVVGWRLSDVKHWLANLPLRSRQTRCHSEETRAKMRLAWERRRARRQGGEAA
jgi:predicted DNA-binding transcriptional regulator AlpA